MFESSILDISPVPFKRKVPYLRAIQSLIEKTREAFETQTNDRDDTLDAYFQGLRDMERTAPAENIGRDQWACPFAIAAK